MEPARPATTSPLPPNLPARISPSTSAAASASPLLPQLPGTLLLQGLCTGCSLRQPCGAFLSSFRSAFPWALAVSSGSSPVAVGPRALIGVWWAFLPSHHEVPLLRRLVAGALGGCWAPGRAWAGARGGSLSLVSAALLRASEAILTPRVLPPPASSPAGRGPGPV